MNNNGFDLNKTEIIQIDQLRYNEPKHLYLKIARIEEENYPTCIFGINLKYDVQEIDIKGNPHGNTYKDSYKINKKVEVKFSDYFKYDPSVKINNFEYYLIFKNKNNLMFLSKRIIKFSQ